jgi:hypothetical protein
LAIAPEPAGGAQAFVLNVNQLSSAAEPIRMNPKELDTPEGWLRFSILHTMCSAVASKSAWIGTLSNWALGTTAVYVPLMIGNLDKIQAILHKPWIVPVFWFALVSAAVGIGIQLSSVWVQIAVQIESQIAPLAIDAFRNPERYNIKPTPADWDAKFATDIISPVRTEFIESRPWAFRELAIYAQEKAENDPAFLIKNAASCTQMMLPFLLLQYVLLGAAVFWAMATLLWK